MKIRILMSMLLAGALTACGGIDGTLSVSEMFHMKDRKGQSYEIPAGSHKVNLKYKESKNRLTVTFDQLNGEETSIEAKTPEGFQLPENGPFALKAADYGQEVDLNGVMKTVQSRTDERWGRENCQYQDWETVCQTNPHTGNTTCTQRPVYRQGWQDIRYYDVITDQTLTADFAKPETSATVANLNGHASYSERYITYRGHCGW